MTFTTYRSRFHFDYFPSNLQRFQETYDESDGDAEHSTSSESSSGELMIRDVNWILGVLGVILPCRMDPILDVEEHDRLREAHKTKLRVLESIWNSASTQDFIATNMEYSIRFADILMNNLLGRRDELTKVLHEDMQNEFEEPAFTIWLSAWYVRLSQLSKKLLRDCALFRIIHGRQFLGQLALLLHSPDYRERRATYRIFSHIVQRNTEEYATLSDVDEKRQAQNTIKSILGIIQSSLYDLGRSNDEITLRPISEVLAIVYESLTFVEDTEFGKPFRTIFLKGIIPLFDNPNYYFFSISYELLIKRELARAKEVPYQQYWEQVSAILVRNAFKRAKGYSEENDACRIRFLLKLYKKGLVSPSQHVMLFSKLFKQVRDRSRWRAQHEFLEFISEPSFLRTFRSDSVYYASNTLRYRVIRELSKAIFEWFLAGDQHEYVRSELSELASAWLGTGAYTNISQTDAEYEALGKRVNEKLLEDIGTMIDNMNLSSDDESSSKAANNSTSQHFEGSGQDDPPDPPKTNITTRIDPVAIQDSQ